MRRFFLSKSKQWKLYHVLWGGLTLAGLAGVVVMELPSIVKVSLLFALFIAREFYGLARGEGVKTEAPHQEFVDKGMGLSASSGSQTFLLDHHESWLSDTVFKELGLGVVTFGSDFRIIGCSLGSFVSVFGEKLTHKSMFPDFFGITTLSEKQKNDLQFHFTSVLGMKKIQWQLSKGAFPNELNLKHRGDQISIKVVYTPIFDEGVIKGVSICFQDITEYKQYKSKAVSREQEIEKIFALLQISESLFELFMDETRNLFNGLKRDLKEIRSNGSQGLEDILSRMFRSVHTIKANAKLFKLASIQDVSHEVEQYLVDLKSGEIAYDEKILRILTTKVMSISEEIYSYASLRKEILGSLGHKNNHHLKYRVQWIRSLLNQLSYILRDPGFHPRNLNVIQKEFSRILATFDRMSIRDYIKGYDELIADVSQSLGKKIHRLETNIDFEDFEPTMLSKINDVLVHCIRNAIDHGIEDPKTRASLGKSELGTIKLLSIEEDGVVTIRLEDDGRGISVPLIKNKARELNLIPEERLTQMSDSELTELVFLSGFSTSQELSEISGRGVGMNAVRDTVSTINASLKIESQENQGTAISIEIPLENEEIIIPFMIYDLEHNLMTVLEEFQSRNGTLVDFQARNQQTLIFGDPLTSQDYLQRILEEFKEVKLNKISVHLSSLEGRRKIDSHLFHRLSFLLEASPGWSGIEINEKLALLGEELKRGSGSLIKRGPTHLEVNIPSNIPVPFSSFTFKIVVMCDPLPNMELDIQRFFQESMSGWAFEIFVRSPETAFPSSIHNEPCIVLIDDASIRAYGAQRDASERSLDGVILLSGEDTNIEALDEIHVVHQNIVFVPRDFQFRTLSGALASVILRRFMASMVRSTSSSATETVAS